MSSEVYPRFLEATEAETSVGPVAFLTYFDIQLIYKKSNKLINFRFGDFNTSYLYIVSVVIFTI